jgi:hypothetical protein
MHVNRPACSVCCKICVVHMVIIWTCIKHSPVMQALDVHKQWPVAAYIPELLPAPGRGTPPCLRCELAAWDALLRFGAGAVPSHSGFSCSENTTCDRVVMGTCSVLHLRHILQAAPMTVLEPSESMQSGLLQNLRPFPGPLDMITCCDSERDSRACTTTLR